MNLFQKCRLAILLILTLPTYSFAAGEMMQKNGLIMMQSQHSVDATVEKAQAIMKEKGLNVFAVINHAENAENNDLDLAPTQVIIFGNPKLGTPLMTCAPTMAIDLPQKFLVYQDKDDNVYLAYNDMDHLKSQHQIEGCDEVIEKIKGALAAISKAATE